MNNDRKETAIIPTGDNAPDRIAIDANGFGWRVWDDQDFWSMVPQNPDNEPIPKPLTWFIRVDDIERRVGQAIAEWATIAGGPHYDRDEHVTLTHYIASVLTGADSGRTWTEEEHDAECGNGGCPGYEFHRVRRGDSGSDEDITGAVCTVIVDASKDIDEAERCGKPAVKRLPGDLDFPVCAEHAEMFSPETRARFEFVPFWHLTNRGWLPEYFGKILRWGDETHRNRVVIVPFVGEFIWWDKDPCDDPTCDCRKP